jgi:trehalose 6-phosphate phosphatase
MSRMSLPQSLIDALEAYARHARVLVATDFDGVLAPFDDDPARVRPLEGAIAALEALAAAGDEVAVVSGRHLESLSAVSGLATDGAITLIGSHGAESTRSLDLAEPMDGAARERLRAATAALQRIADRHSGARLEHKPAGVALHTRGVDPSVARSASAAALDVGNQLPQVHVLAGKDVVELGVLPVSKGQALTALARESAAGAVLYLGDDVTDETVFAVLPGIDGHVTVKVGPGDTAATYRVNGPPDAVAVLELVARLRSSKWTTG